MRITFNRVNLSETVHGSLRHPAIKQIASQLLKLVHFNLPTEAIMKFKMMYLQITELIKKHVLIVYIFNSS